MRRFRDLLAGESDFAWIELKEHTPAAGLMSPTAGNRCVFHIVGLVSGVVQLSVFVSRRSL
jgi:hypothetical protein